MKKKIGFAAGIVLFAVALLSTRFYMVDLPVWHALGGGSVAEKGLTPPTLSETGFNSN